MRGHTPAIEVLIGSRRTHSSPFLQAATEHCERMVELLIALEGRTPRGIRQRWLVGRAAEVECVVQVVTSDRARGLLSVADAVRSLNAYLQGLHRGLALHFGELAPSCCLPSLLATAIPSSALAITPQFPSSRHPTADLSTTWEVDDAQILEVTYAPSSG